jgi:hypothetical protein
MDTPKIGNNVIHTDEATIAAKSAAAATVPVMLIAVGSLIIVCVVGLHFLFVQSLRENSRRVECISNLREIGITCHNIHDTLGVFPTDVNSATGCGIWDDILLFH